LSNSAKTQSNAKAERGKT